MSTVFSSSVSLGVALSPDPLVNDLTFDSNSSLVDTSWNTEMTRIINIAMMIVIILLMGIASVSADEGSFTISQEANTFLLNGEPFRFVSGSVHYFRIHPEYWNDRLMKIRAGGFNAILMPVEWAYHEHEAGKFDFDGPRDIESFLKLAQANDLHVIS